MNIKRILSRIRKDYGSFHVRGACGYLSLELNPKTAGNDKPETTAPAAFQEVGRDLSDTETYLVSKFSTLSEEDKSALLRFVSNAARSCATEQQSDEGPENDKTANIEGWLDEQARLHTQTPTL